MALSLDFWRTVQRLRTDAERRERTLARAAHETAARRRRRRTERGWRLMALHALVFAAPIVAVLAVSPQAVRSNAQLLIDTAAMVVRGAAP